MARDGVMAICPAVRIQIQTVTQARNPFRSVYIVSARKKWQPRTINAFTSVLSHAIRLTSLSLLPPLLLPHLPSPPLICAICTEQELARERERDGREIARTRERERERGRVGGATYARFYATSSGRRTLLVFSLPFSTLPTVVTYQVINHPVVVDGSQPSKLSPPDLTVVTRSGGFLLAPSLFIFILCGSHHGLSGRALFPMRPCMTAGYNKTGKKEGFCIILHGPVTAFVCFFRWDEEGGW